jgi:acyl dehydratase
MSIRLDLAKPGEVVAMYEPPPSTPEDLVRYAHASGDMNPLHLDAEFARKAGFERLVVHGMLSMAHLGRLLTDSFPPASIKTFRARFSAVVLVGQRVRYQAILEERREGLYRLILKAITDSDAVAIQGFAEIDAQCALP